MNINERYQRLLSRRAPSDDRIIARFAESYETQPGQHTKYILGALKPVEPKYTERLAQQGDRVEEQLKKRITDAYPGIEFRRQGSVSNLTHIRYYSDVDVLVIIDKFFGLEPPQIPANPYKGIPEDDLLELRQRCAAELGKAFYAADVDNSGANSICLTGGSLVCKVDVVPSNWFDSNDYARERLEYYRGIQILNKNENLRKKNFPFLFNHRIDANDKARKSIPRMLIRLLKTIRSDSEDDKKPIDFSSFDICSVVYRMPEEYLKTEVNEPLDILRNLLLWMMSILERDSLRNELMVVDDSRKIFDKVEKAREFKKLFDDLLEVYNGAKKENPYSLITKAHAA